MMRTDHLVSSQHITINEKAFQSLSPDLQKIVTDAAQEAVAWGRKEVGEGDRGADHQDRCRRRQGHQAGSRSRSPTRPSPRSRQMEQDGAWCPRPLAEDPRHQVTPLIASLARR